MLAKPSWYDMLIAVVNELNACSQNYGMGFKVSIKEDQFGHFKIVYEKENL